MDREREREKSIRFASITGLTWREKSIDHPEPHGWRERDTRVLGPRTRNSPEMTVPRALFRQSAARFIANFRASITETMAANRCPCIPPCTSVRHRDSIESWSSIKLESSPPNNSYGGFVPITSLSTGKTPPQLSSFSKKTFLFLPFLLSPFSLFLCFLKKRFLLLFSPLFPREWQPLSRLFLIRDHSLGKLYYYFGERKDCSRVLSAEKSLPRERNNFSRDSTSSLTSFFIQ